MEPMTTPVHPAPIMDIAPPPKPQTTAVAQTSALPQPPVSKEVEQPIATQKLNQSSPRPRPQLAVAKPVGPTLPALPIAVAIVFFAALTALTYYAYTKSG